MEFREVFYIQYFSVTVIKEKKIEFIALEQRNMTIASLMLDSMHWRGREQRSS